MPVNKRLRRRIDEAAARFENFTGDELITVDTIDVPPIDDALMVIGPCVAIAYEATRDGETAQYQHEFSKDSRPVLAVSSDGKRLYLLAGAYEFTSHGIEDRPA